MAENLQWVLENEGPDGKIMVWAHNMHVSAAGGEPAATLGSELRRTLGDRYLPIGLFFDGESFRAFSVPRAPGDHTQDFEAGPTPDGTLEDALRAAGSNTFGLSLLDLPEAGAARSWLDEERRMRAIGWSYSPDKPERVWQGPPTPGLRRGVLPPGRGHRRTQSSASRKTPLPAPRRGRSSGARSGMLFRRTQRRARSWSRAHPGAAEGRGLWRRPTASIGGAVARLDAPRALLRQGRRDGEGQRVGVGAREPGHRHRTKEVAYADARVSGATLRRYEVKDEAVLGAPTVAPVLDLAAATLRGQAFALGIAELALLR